jgi:hypothetical protein
VGPGEAQKHSKPSIALIFDAYFDKALDVISSLSLNIDLRHITSPPLILCISFGVKYTLILLDGQVEVGALPY